MYSLDYENVQMLLESDQSSMVKSVKKSNVMIIAKTGLIKQNYLYIEYEGNEPCGEVFCYYNQSHKSNNINNAF